MFDNRGFAAVFDIRHSVRTAIFANQQAVTLRIVARAAGVRRHPDQTAVGLIGTTGRNAFGYDFGSGVLPM